MNKKTIYVSIFLIIIFASIIFAILYEPKETIPEHLKGDELKEYLVEEARRVGEDFSKEEVLQIHETNELFEGVVKEYYGKKFPKLDVINKDDELVSLLDEYEGKPLIIEIMGSWCDACKEGLPIIDDFNKKYDIPFILVGKNDHVSDMKDFVGDHKIPYYAAYDFEEFNSEIDVSFVPVVFFLDESHRIKMIHGGPTDLGYVEYIKGRIYENEQK